MPAAWVNAWCGIHRATKETAEPCPKALTRRLPTAAPGVNTLSNGRHVIVPTTKVQRTWSSGHGPADTKVKSKTACPAGPACDAGRGRTKGEKSKACLQTVAPPRKRVPPDCKQLGGGRVKTPAAAMARLRWERRHSARKSQRRSLGDRRGREVCAGKGQLCSDPHGDRPPPKTGLRPLKDANDSTARDLQSSGPCRITG